MENNISASSENTDQNITDQHHTKSNRHKFRKYILPVIIICLLTFLLGAYILFSSAQNLLKSSKGEVISQDFKTAISSKLKDLSVQLPENQLNDTQTDSKKIALGSALDPSSDTGSSSITDHQSVVMDRNFGYATKYKVYGSYYGDMNSTDTSLSVKDAAEIDESKFYVRVNIYSADFNKSYIVSQNKYYNYIYSDSEKEIYYYGNKYAAKLKYSKPREVYYEYYPDNIWVLESLANDPNARDLGFKTINGVSYRYFEITNSFQELSADQMIRPEDASSQSVTRIYLTRDDLSVFRIEMADQNGNLTSITETIEEKKLPISEIISMYKNTNELESIETRDFVYEESEYKIPKFVEIVKKYPIIYGLNSTLLGYGENIEKDDTPITKLYRDPDFIEQFSLPESTLPDQQISLVTYYESDLNYQVYNSLPKNVDSGVGMPIEEKEITIKINGVEQVAKLSKYKFIDAVQISPSAEGEGATEKIVSNDVVVDNLEGSTTGENIGNDFGIQSLLVNFQGLFYQITSYGLDKPFPTEFQTLDETKAAAIDQLLQEQIPVKTDGSTTRELGN